MSESAIKFGSIGECMVEMSHLEDDDYRMGYAGDTYNVALYAKRCAHPDKIHVDYITALGDDPYSQRMLDKWSAEGVCVDYVAKYANRLPGVYFITLDKSKDRHMYYYRSESPARNMFDGEEGSERCEKLLDFDALYFSGITLAVLTDESRDKFFDVLARAHQQGTVVAFDNNYRARLWDSVEQAREVYKKALAHVNVALPSFEDAKTLYNDKTPAGTAERFHEMGVNLAIVKQGDKGYLLSDGKNVEQFPAVKAQELVDTTCAGDSFNGAFLAKWLTGSRPAEAANFAAGLAATVVSHRGAIISKADMREFLSIPLREGVERDK